MTEMTHCFPIRVYYEDTDHGGVVYYANYLKFMERARTEFLRSGGIELDALEADHGLMFVVNQMQVKFIKPARFNDLLQVESQITAARGARVTMLQRILDAEGRLLVEAEIQLACMDRKGKPRRMPDFVAGFFHQHLTREKEHA